MTDTKKPRYSRLTDILQLLSLMMERPRGVCLNDICEKFNVSRRTAERMRDTILDAFPQVCELRNGRSKTKYWGFQNYSMPEVVKFSEDEFEFLVHAAFALKDDDIYNKNYCNKEKIDRIIAKAYFHSTKTQESYKVKIGASVKMLSKKIIELIKEYKKEDIAKKIS